MLPVVKTRERIILIALLGVALMGPSASRAEEADRDEKSRWVPAFSLSSGAFVQLFQGTLGASTANCGTENNPTCYPSPWTIADDEPFLLQRGTPHTNRTRVFTPFVAVNLELTTPSLMDDFGAPSLFAHVDFAYAFGSEKNIAVLDSPGPLVPPPASGQGSAAEWKGQGDQMTLKASDFQFSGGIGMAFHFDVADRRVRIKPSLEYMRQSMEMRGFLQRVIRTNQPGQPGVAPAYRFVDLTERKTVVFHSIGPGLEVEMDAARTGPLVLSLYGGVRAYAILMRSNRVELSDSNELGESATWEYLANRWSFGGSVGLRFRWLPK
ncbi:MAG: hypothetical protein VX252_17110 [Myxococcota bacterium]|nr:hypothetical protein [Myxococcota bacterium]